MRPSKPKEQTIVDALDVLLLDGALVQADILITVADVPLIGLNLRAAIAGMTTMTEYGLFEDWDIETRDRGRTRREFGYEPRPQPPPLSIDSRKSTNQK